MDRYAIFVDAGYFFAAGAQAAFGLHVPPITRKQISVKSAQAMLTALCHEAAKPAENISLLRVYWYDAMPGPRMSLDQTALALLSGVKLRLGALNSAGEQKGVDSLIVTDIIDLARNKAISDAVVVTGDEDLRVAFQVAQSFGVRVHILAAGDPTKNVSPSLQMEADSVTALDSNWFSNQFDLKPTVVPAAASIVAKEVLVTTSIESELSIKTTPSALQVVTFEDAAKSVIPKILSNLTSDQLKQLAGHVTIQRTIPPEYDRPFIAKVSAALSGQRLSGDQLRVIRGMLITSIKAAEQQVAIDSE